MENRNRMVSFCMTNKYWHDSARITVVAQYFSLSNRLLILRHAT